MGLKTSKSRYANAENIIDIPRLHLLNLVGSIPVTQYTTKAGDRLTSLAGKYYGSKMYYWIIAEVNDMFDVREIFNVLPPGKLLLIPSEKILKELQNAITN